MNILMNQVFNYIRENGSISIGEYLSLESAFKELPDVLYFASSAKYNVLRGDRLFLSSHIGIASLFTVRDFAKQSLIQWAEEHLGHKPYKMDYNLGYLEWSSDSKDEPFNTIHIRHNIPGVRDVLKGVSTGYIHIVDTSSLKGRLQSFGNSDVLDDVVYTGSDIRPIKVIQHTARWELKFDPYEVKVHGIGSIQ